MGDVGIPNQSDHWWCVILYLDRTYNWNRWVSTAVRVSVCDLIDSRNEVIDRTIGIC